MQELLGVLPTSKGTELERRLVFLLSQQCLELDVGTEDFLFRLLQSAGSPSADSPYQLLALQIALGFGTPRLWTRLIVDGALEPNDVAWFRERWPGRQEFLGFHTSIEYAKLRCSVDLASLGHLLVAGDRLDSDLALYVVDLDARIRKEWERGSDPFRPAFKVSFSVPCMRAVFKFQPETVKGWLRFVLVKKVDWVAVNFAKSTLPLFEALCEALFLDDDPRASELYESLFNLTRQKESFFRDEIGDTLPLLLLRSYTESAFIHLESWYHRCWSDKSLLDFSTAVLQSGRHEIIVRLVERGLASSMRIEEARAVSLAGWCGAIPEVRHLLQGRAYVTGSWFDLLKDQSVARNRNEDWAKYWFAEFLFSRSMAGSFSGFRLFLRCVDRRYYAWYPVLASRAKVSRAGRRRLRFVTANGRDISKRIESSEKELEKYFLYLKIPDERLVPWTGLPPVRQGVSVPDEAPEFPSGRPT